MSVRLTPTSFIVLGLVRWSPGASAYDLERLITATTGHMWAIQRSQIYREPVRLTEAGLLAGSEQEGRRGTQYSITAAGESAFEAWLEADVDDRPQLRDLAILKLFFGATPAGLARTRIAQHQDRLREYEVIESVGGLAPGGPMRAIKAAILHERASIAFWTELLADDA